MGSDDETRGSSLNDGRQADPNPSRDEPSSAPFGRWVLNYTRRVGGKWPFWGLPLVLLFMAMLRPVQEPTDADALLILVFICLALPIVHALLPFNPFDPRTIFRWVFKYQGAAAEFRDILSVALLVAVLMGSFLGVRGLIGLAHWLDEVVRRHGGRVDGNTMTIFVACAAAAMLVSLTCAVVGFANRRLDAVGLRTDLWVEIGWALATVAVALVPAALLAAWTWNVVASLIVPIVVAHARVDRRRYEAAHQSG